MYSIIFIRFLGANLQVDDFRKFDFSSGNVFGVLVQYPNTEGRIEDYSELLNDAHNNQVCLCVSVFVCACTCMCACVYGQARHVYIHALLYLNSFNINLHVSIT